MVQADERLNVGCMQRIKQTRIEVQPLLVDRAIAVRYDARPGNGEAKVLQPQQLHGCNVNWVQVIEIVRHCTCNSGWPDERCLNIILLLRGLMPDMHHSGQLQPLALLNLQCIACWRALYSLAVS